MNSRQDGGILDDLPTLQEGHALITRYIGLAFRCIFLRTELMDRYIYGYLISQGQEEGLLKSYSGKSLKTEYS